MSSPNKLYGIVRQFNFLSMSTPPAFEKAQVAVRLVGLPEIAAAARWGVAGGFLFYWMIEQNVEEKTEA